MSRITTPGPDSRLLLGHTGIQLVTDDITVASADPADSSFSRSFSALCQQIPDHGRGLCVVLPDEEVWKGSTNSDTRTPAGYAQAVDLAAIGLDLPPGSVVMATGRADDDGQTPIAAIRKTTLRETQSFLSGYGITAHTLTCDWDVAGFAGQERSAANTPVMASLQRRMILATSGLAACLTLGAYFLLSSDPIVTNQETIPITQAVASEDPIPKTPASVSPMPVLKISEAPPRPRSDTGPGTTLTMSSAPAARPRPVLVTAQFSPAPEARTAPPAALLVPTVLSSRNAPEFTPSSYNAGRPEQPQSSAQAVLLKTTVASLRRSGSTKILDTPDSSGPRVAATTLRPFQRPGAQRVSSDPAAERQKQPNTVTGTTRPRPRLVVGNKALNTAITTAVSQAAGTGVSVKPATSSVAALKSARPLPRRFKVRPAAKTNTGTTFKKVAPAVTQKAMPAPTKKAIPKKQTAPKQSANAKERVGLKRREISLVGLFGSSKHRRAILMLPNGQFKKVRPGDRVNSVRVASVGSKSVRLTERGRDTILKLP